MDETAFDDLPNETVSQSSLCIPADDPDVEDLIFDGEGHGCQDDGRYSTQEILSFASSSNPILDRLLDVPVVNSRQELDKQLKEENSSSLETKTTNNEPGSQAHYFQSTETSDTDNGQNASEKEAGQSDSVDKQGSSIEEKIIERSQTTDDDEAIGGFTEESVSSDESFNEDDDDDDGSGDESEAIVSEDEMGSLDDQQDKEETKEVSLEPVKERKRVKSKKNKTSDDKSPKSKKEKSPKGKKRRKPESSFHRRNIKKIMTEEKLDPKVLAARKEEEERIERQKQAMAEFMKHQQEQLKQHHHYPQQHLQSSQECDEIYLSSDEEEDVKDLNHKEAREELIELLSDDDENCASDKFTNNDQAGNNKSLGKQDDSDDEEELDMNNCGMFADDKYNCSDAEGRVLINVGHVSGEEDIFLSKQLAKAVKPHQIGGIRFMYANIIESTKKFDSTPGVGCILAHSMGLGKTLQVISFVDVFLSSTSAKSVLIIVPINTLQNWVSEFDQWIPKEPTIADSLNGTSKNVEYRKFTLYVLNDSCKTLLLRSKEIILWKKTGGVLLLGYEMYRILVQEADKTSKNQSDLPAEKMSQLLKELKEALVDPGPDLVVCDEGHRIKNSQSLAAQALKNIRTRRRIVLTGYPLQNNLMEYWCMVDFVRPNYLGSSTEFSNMFDRPIRNGQCIDSSLFDQKVMRERSHVLYKLLKGFVQRRSHTILKECLPPKFEYVFLTKMTPLQKKLMLTFISYLSDTNGGSSDVRFNPIVLYSVCNKIWNHPDILYKMVNEDNVLDLEEDLELDGVNTSRKKGKNQGKNKSNASTSNVSSTSTTFFSAFSNGSNTQAKDRALDYSWAKPCFEGYVPNLLENSTKMTMLMDLIDKIIAGDERLLVFSQSLLTLSLIEQFLSERTVPNTNDKWMKHLSYYRLDGSTSSQDREKYINHFNRDSALKLFLLSTKAGSLGINLTGANRIIIFDASWNPCHDAQAACRIYRYGQKRPCFIYRLICDNSLEKKIYDRQVNKQGMSNRVIDEMNPETIFSSNQLTKLVDGLDQILEPDEVNVSDRFLSECPDPLVVDACITHKSLLTKVPFEHESLLLDDKQSKLSKSQKREAERNYQAARRQKNGFHYNHSYSNVPPSYTWSNNNGSSSSPSSGFFSHRHPFNFQGPSSTYTPWNSSRPTLFSGSPLLPTPQGSPSFLLQPGSNEGNFQSVNQTEGSAMSNGQNLLPASSSLLSYPNVAGFDLESMKKFEEKKQQLRSNGFVEIKTIIIQQDIKLTNKQTGVMNVVPKGETVLVFKNHRDESRVLLTKDSKVIDIKHADFGPRIPPLSRSAPNILRRPVTSTVTEPPEVITLDDD